jgi:hypothetical protein
LVFLDDDDAYAAEPAPPSRQYGPPRNQFLVRRIAGVAILVLILILLLLGIRGCLNARKERGLENYVSDMTSIVQQSDQLSNTFFDRLQNAQGQTPIAFQQQIAADRGTADSLSARVTDLDTPGDLEDDQGGMELAFQLRAQAMDGIANQISAALGDKGAAAAQQKIAGYMRWFVASDVLYGRAKDGMNETLADEDISGRIPDDRFLDDDKWLDPAEVGSALGGVSGTGAGATKGVHGLALLASTLNGVTLVDGGVVTVTGGPPFELVAQVQNQGDSTENTTVEYKWSAGFSGSGQAQLSNIASGATKNVTIDVRQAPETGSSATLTVTVQEVPGEQISDNNTQSYTITFG